jgi:hypothetical protein
MSTERRKIWTVSGVFSATVTTGADGDEDTATETFWKVASLLDSDGFSFEVGDCELESLPEAEPGEACDVCGSPDVFVAILPRSCPECKGPKRAAFACVRGACQSMARHVACDPCREAYLNAQLGGS